MGHGGQARVDGVALVARVAHGMGVAHGNHLGLDEQGMLERGLRGVAFVAGVVGVHEEEGAGLQLAIHPAGRFVHQCAGAGARDQRHGQPGGFDEAARVRRLLHGAGNGFAPFGGAGKVLGAAMVSLQPGKAQPWVAGHRQRQGHGGLARRHTAAALAHVNLYQHIHARVAARLRHRFGQALDALRAVHRHTQAAAPAGKGCGQPRRTVQLGHGNHFVGDGDVQHAASGQGFSFGHFLYAHALCPGLLQQQGQLGAFVHLGVGPPAHLVLAGEVGHALDVAVHGVQVHHQGGGVDQVYPLADEGGEGVRRGFHRVRRCPGAVCLPSPPG